MINANNACLHCPYPVNLNTYLGCTHACKYCYSSKSKNIRDIKPYKCKREIENFISGKRTKVLQWVDWKAPLHIGTMGDPLQPCEVQYRATLEALQVLQAHQYPYIITTKGALVAEEPYLSIFANSVCVVQISMCCPAYDAFEEGAPSFEKRLRMVERLASKGIRVVCRAEPYMIRYETDIIDNVKRIAEAGAYGIKCGGYFSPTYHNGMEKVGGTYKYKRNILARSYYKMREECHKYGLVFNCQEESLRTLLSDEMECCGTKGMPEFIPNKFISPRLFEGEDVEPTLGMTIKGTAQLLRMGCQDTVKGNMFKRMSYEDYVRLYLKEWYPDYKRERMQAKTILQRLEKNDI